MDYFAQIVIEFFVLIVFSSVLLKFLMKFKLRKFFVAIFLLPLVLFVIGFSLRFVNDKILVDTGFFLTDFSFLFVYLLTALALILGQLKYWKVK